MNVPKKGPAPAQATKLPPIKPNPNATAEGIAERFERNFPGVLKAMGQID